MPFIDKSTLTLPATSAFPIRRWLDQNRAPTSSDYKNFQVFDLWIWEGQSAWIMIDKTATSGQWVEFSTSGTGILSITGDSGGAVSANAAHNINLLSGANLTITGNPSSNTLTVTLDGTVADEYITDSGSAVPSGGILNVVGTGGTNTSGSGDTITITSGPTIPTSFVTDSGTATPDLNILDILGGTGIATSGSGHTVTIAIDTTIATTYTCDSGSASPAANNLNVLGGGSTTTSGSGSTITVSSSGGGYMWYTITVVGPTAMAVDSGYVADYTSPVQLTLPLTSVVGSTIKIVGKGSGGWKVDQNAGQSIRLVDAVTTVGVTGSLTSSEANATVSLICMVANTEWIVESSTGNFIIV